MEWNMGMSVMYVACSQGGTYGSRSSKEVETSCSIVKSWGAGGFVSLGGKLPLCSPRSLIDTALAVFTNKKWLLQCTCTQACNVSVQFFSRFHCQYNCPISKPQFQTILFFSCLYITDVSATSEGVPVAITRNEAVAGISTGVAVAGIFFAITIMVAIAIIMTTIIITIIIIMIL